MVYTTNEIVAKENFQNQIARKRVKIAFENAAAIL
jgi:hypothetical protein